VGRAGRRGAKAKTNAGADRRREENVSLPKKDVRAWLSQEAHAVLSAVADLNEKDVGEQASLLLERTLLGEAHSARLLAERAARFGKTRTAAEIPGKPEKQRGG
jgi:hypothetical protein